MRSLSSVDESLVPSWAMGTFVGLMDLMRKIIVGWRLGVSGKRWIWKGFDIFIPSFYIIIPYYLISG